MLSKKEKDVLYLVMKSEDGVLPEDIAKELNMKSDEVKTILDDLEEKGFLFSKEEEEN
ncbi:MAG: MarR family transcriptional regulator [Candidatus Helarchaeota archaeon]